MLTTDPAKNAEYFKRSQAKEEETVGKDAFEKIYAEIEQGHRGKKKFLALLQTANGRRKACKMFVEKVGFEPRTL